MRLNLESLAGLKGLVETTAKGHDDQLTYFVGKDDSLLCDKKGETVVFLGNATTLEIFLSILLDCKFQYDFDQDDQWVGIVASAEEVANRTVSISYRKVVRT